MNTIQAQEGMWLFNGESFAKKVSGFGSLSKWKEVTEEFKTQWEEEHQVEDGLVPDVGGGNISNEPELLCDLTTTEYAVEAVWTQGDNGQVFDDYKEIYIKMLLQPTENSVNGFKIHINTRNPMCEYGFIGSETLLYPKPNDKAGLYLVRLYKTGFGIQQEIRTSYNNSSAPMFSAKRNDSIVYVRNYPDTPDKLQDANLPQHFECIKIGSYVANMPPNCRFMIYGLK